MFSVPKKRRPFTLDGRFIMLILLLLCTLPPALACLVPSGMKQDYLNIIESLFGSLIGAVIAGLVIFLFQRRIERAKFLQSYSDSMNKVMADGTAWVVHGFFSEAPSVEPVDFRYAIGKHPWPFDPAEIVPCEGKDKPFHLSRHLALQDRRRIKIQFPGLIYRISRDDDEVQLLVASKAIHEYTQLIWTALHAYDNGLVSPDDLVSQWRALDLACPKKDRFEEHDFVPTRKWFETNENGSFLPRWIEFFLFGTKCWTDDDAQCFLSERACLVKNPMFRRYAILFSQLRSRVGLYRVDTLVDKKS